MEKNTDAFHEAGHAVISRWAESVAETFLGRWGQAKTPVLAYDHFPLRENPSVQRLSVICREILLRIKQKEE